MSERVFFTKRGSGTKRYTDYIDVIAENEYGDPPYINIPATGDMRLEDVPGFVEAIKEAVRIAEGGNNDHKAEYARKLETYERYIKYWHELSKYQKKRAGRKFNWVGMNEYVYCLDQRAMYVISRLPLAPADKPLTSKEVQGER